MNLLHRAFLLTAFLSVLDGGFVSTVFAQGPVLPVPDPSRRLGTVGTSTFPGSRDGGGAEVVSQLEEENRFAPPSAGDRDIGDQLILKEAPKQRRFRVLADGYVFWTDNAGNTPSGQVSDTFVGSQVQAGWQPRLAGRWFADIELTQTLFRYDTYDVLDFEVFEANTNLAHVLTRFGNVVVFAGPQYRRMTTNSFQDELVESVSMLGGVQKIFLLDRRNSIHVSAMVDRDLSTDLDQVFRHEYMAEVVWRHKIMRDLVLSPSIRHTLFDYTRVSRDDAMTVAGLSLTWMPRRWAELYISGNFSSNDSNIDVFDFDTATVGGGLGVKLRF